MHLIRIFTLAGAIGFNFIQYVDAQFARIPLKTYDRNIHIKIKVKNLDSLLFGFDTGCTVTFIDSLSALKAGMKMDDSKQKKVAGNTGARTYRIAVKQQLDLGDGLILKKVNLLLENFANYKAFSGVDMKGIIGYDFLKSYVVKLDFVKQEMLVYQHIKEVDTIGYSNIPFEFHKGLNIPRIPVTIRTGKNEVFTGKVMFDSGAGTTLVISAPFRNFHRLGSKMKIIEEVKVSGVNAETTNERAIIDGMIFNGFNFGKMVVNTTVDHKAEPKDGFLGLLGMEVIKRFDVILDYQRKILYLKPNRDYNLPF